MSMMPLRTLRDASPSFVVSVVDGPDAGASVTLDASRPRVLVGHSAPCTLRLNDPAVSRTQLALLVQGDRISLVDLGSRSGTTVNGVLVERAFLRGGEAVRIGCSVLVVERDDHSGPPTREASVVPRVVDATDLMGAVISQDLQFSAARERVMREFERRYVDRILAAHDGNVTRAARASGVALRYFKLVRARLKNQSRS